MQLLTLGGFLLTLGEAVVYYVSPTEPPNSDCPSQPCHTLDYYSCNGENYFSSEKVNVTIVLMQGNHTLQYCEIAIEHLETCKIIGIGSARDVTVYTFLKQGISFTDVMTIYIGKLTLIGDESLITLFFAVTLLT